MTFLETFTAVFMATLMSQVSIWLIERYIKARVHKALDKAHHIIGSKVKNMSKIMVDLEETKNGIWIAEIIRKQGSFITQSEKDKYIFNNWKEFGKIIEEHQKKQ